MEGLVPYQDPEKRFENQKGTKNVGVYARYEL